jgi:hypothetical protein
MTRYTRGDDSRICDRQSCLPTGYSAGAMHRGTQGHFDGLQVESAGLALLSKDKPRKRAHFSRRTPTHLGGKRCFRVPGRTKSDAECHS